VFDPRQAFQSQTGTAWVVGGARVVAPSLAARGWSIANRRETLSAAAVAAVQSDQR